MRLWRVAKHVDLLFHIVGRIALLVTAAAADENGESLVAFPALHVSGREHFTWPDAALRLALAHALHMRQESRPDSQIGWSLGAGHPRLEHLLHLLGRRGICGGDY